MANVRIWLASETALESMMSNLYVFKGYYIYMLCIKQHNTPYLLEN